MAMCGKQCGWTRRLFPRAINVLKAALNQRRALRDVTTIVQPLGAVVKAPLEPSGTLIEAAQGAGAEPRRPAAIERALWARDGGCRSPGCGRKRYVHAHYVVHWSAGGETSLDNLMLLCAKHHMLLHEGGFTIDKDYRDRWFFRRPDGRAVPACGNRPEDITDDTVETAGEYLNGHASAETSCHPADGWSVREPQAAAYWPLGTRGAQTPPRKRTWSGWRSWRECLGNEFTLR